MWKHGRGGVLLAVLSGLVPVGLMSTQLSAGIFSSGCRSCQRPVSTCNCTAQRPVVETQMIPQQVTTYRNEVVTQYRQEAVTQNVPVTTYRDMVVDEGSYQTVYVPKQVTKRIPQIGYQQQVAYRSVPYQVIRQVPQVVTQMVPQQVTRYQPYSYQTIQAAPFVASACDPCGGTAFAPPAMYSTAPVVTQPYLSTRPIGPNPVTMLPPTSTTLSSTAAAESTPHNSPVPDPKFLDSPGAAQDSWTKVGSRNGSRSQIDHFDDSRTASRSSGLFKPARTVYRSWESQSRIAAGESTSRQ